MSNVSKGQSKELLCRKELEKDGWTIVFKSIRTRWGSYDLADLFDVVAIKIIADNFTKFPIWKLISVKNYASFKNLPQHQEEIENFKNSYGLSGMVYELWLWSKARWVGRGKNKHWQDAQWVKKVI